MSDCEVVESAAKRAKTSESDANKGYKFTLYTYWRSSASYRVRTVLAMKGLAYTSIPTSLLENKQSTDEYAKLNPMRQVPCFVVEQEGKEPFVINQSLAIIDFLERKFPENSIYPVDECERAKAQEYALDVASGIHPVQNFGVCYFRPYSQHWCVLDDDFV